MGKTVIANGRSIIHKGHGATHVCAIPDVCKTPSPGGPVPIPYVNVAKDGDLSKGSKKVKIEGNPVAHKDSVLSTSTGDEAGTAGGGIVSSKTKGKMSWPSVSMDVKVEGKGVARFMDPTLHNGNAYNTGFLSSGTVDYGGDPIDGKNCAVCDESKDKHIIGTVNSLIKTVKKLCDQIRDPEGGFRKEFVRKNGRPLNKGVMIGGLICQCGEHSYSGIAGQFKDGQYKKSADEFKLLSTSGAVNMIPCVAYPLAPPMTGLLPPSNTQTSFNRMTKAKWATLEKEVDDVTQEYAGNRIFNCAAPKMIQACLNDGHKPKSMVEMWVSLETSNDGNSKGVSISKLYLKHKSSGWYVRKMLNFVSSGGISPPKLQTRWELDKHFGDGDIIPSCTTCQVILTPMLCALGNPPC